MSLYSRAVESIRGMVDRRQAELDCKARLARQANIEATREQLRGLVDEDDEMRPVAELLANTLIIGREGDNWPERSFPQETMEVFWAALQAVEGDNHPFHNLLYGKAISLSNITRAEQSTDEIAWRAAYKYRESNKREVSL